MKTKEKGSVKGIQRAQDVLAAVGEMAKRSVFQPTTYASFEGLPHGSALRRDDGAILVVNAGAARVGQFLNATDEVVKIAFDAESFSAMDGEFHDKEGRKYVLVKFGTEDQERELAESISKIKAATEAESAAWGNALTKAREKGETLLKARLGLSAPQWRDYLALVELPYSSAAVYSRLAKDWEKVKPGTHSLVAALRQISKSEKEAEGKSGGKPTEPRLQPWEQKVLDIAKELKVRGSHGNLIRFLAKFGVSEDSVKTMLAPRNYKPETEVPTDEN